MVTLISALHSAFWTHIQCGDYAAAHAQLDEFAALADEKGALYWKAWRNVLQGCLCALTGKSSDAVLIVTSGLTAFRPTQAKLHVPICLSFLAQAYAQLGQFDDASRCIGEATMVIAAGERWFDAEVNRIAGEIGLLSREPDAKAEAYFERAISVARQQQAKSWELRATMSMARLWRDQGKREEARDLLAPVYGWFTEGFDTLDLKEAKALLDELSS